MFTRRIGSLCTDAVIIGWPFCSLKERSDPSLWFDRLVKKFRNPIAVCYQATPYAFNELATGWADLKDLALQVQIRAYQGCVVASTSGRQLSRTQSISEEWELQR